MSSKIPLQNPVQKVPLLFRKHVGYFLISQRHQLDTFIRGKRLKRAKPVVNHMMGGKCHSEIAVLMV